MKFSTTRLKQIAKLLAEEVKEQLTEKQGFDEMEQTMRELVKAAAGLGLQEALEPGEERYTREETECSCGAKAKFVSKRKATLWTVLGKANCRRRYYLCADCHQGQSPLDQKYGLALG